ncbi:serine/threonine protein phosphatase PP1, putative [Entamoeba nuttalli P19]|uniref:Serine/threonine-protein phosphatase n=1 Tax=Entamoeba nuttalli (strain P19) TaxID=1076696 RepID=K2GB05_ENTNP|nr:serine/threonine protein phosphatase PP1, putative [Entamoeba nuttalli P19]EKE39656.1 serine/threonine protein phosphatase PP1, putative [Entamoeba nuttalli P19]|eukprot:XP_008857998.1 serine/threonine protein phosphatase PP1, putative [Entamoeba nuttalli P19]
MDTTHLDDIISRLMNVINSFPENIIVTKDEIMQLCDVFQEEVSKDETLMELKAPINIIGDLHGQFTDLIRFLKAVNYTEEKFLFLGDFVDRGCHSIEVLCLVYALKARYPQQFFIIRGNHECEEINRVFGFYDECIRRYDESVWKRFNATFAYLPILALINKKILCVHGGISPDLKLLSQIQTISRPLQIPCGGMVCDLLWSDPGSMFGWKPNTVRGMSHYYGEDVCIEFMERNELELICRGHEVVDGYQFKFNQKLVTLFSSPVYCNALNNSGAMMVVADDLTCSFVILKVDK